MISLWIATFCSASIALLFKFSAIKKLDQSWVTMANYLTASLFSGYMLLTDPFDYAHGNDLSITLIIGLITGVFFLLSFVVYQISVRNNGASMSGMFAKLGILIPMIVSVVVWREIPTSIQFIGICIALLAIAIANHSPKKSSMKAHSIKWLLALFISGGIAEFSNKIFQKSVPMDYRSLFLFTVFTTALILSVLMHVRKKENQQAVNNPWLSIFVGVLVGIPNLMASYFLLNALNEFPASIVYPAYSAGSIVLISLLSVTLFKEVIYKKDWIAIGLTSMSLILLNL